MQTQVVTKKSAKPTTPAKAPAQAKAKPAKVSKSVAEAVVKSAAMAKSKAKAPVSKAPVAKAPVAKALVIELLVDKNPKRGASHSRFALYRDGMTVDAYVARCVEAGCAERLARADIRWDQNHKFIAIK